MWFLREFSHRILYVMPFLYSNVETAWNAMYWQENDVYVETPSISHEDIILHYFTNH